MHYLEFSVTEIEPQSRIATLTVFDEWGQKVCVLVCGRAGCFESGGCVDCGGDRRECFMKGVFRRGSLG